jgi:hypothetical protein
MLMHFGSASRSTLRLVAILMALVVGIVVAADRREKRIAQARRVLTDVDLIERSTRGYRTEGQKLTRKFEDDAAWKAYCYSERAALIEEARAASK